MQLPLVVGICVWFVRINGPRPKENEMIPQAVSWWARWLVGLYLGSRRWSMAA